MWDLPEVSLVSASGTGGGSDLSEVIRAVQCYLLCNNPESNFLTGANSIIEYMELLKNFAGTAAEPGYNP